VLFIERVGFEKVFFDNGWDGFRNNNDFLQLRISIKGVKNFHSKEIRKSWRKIYTKNV